MVSVSDGDDSDAEMSVDLDATEVPEGSDVDMEVADEEDLNNGGVTRSQIDNRIAALHSENNEAMQQINTKGEPGHIQQIVLQNFMCHENFTVNLGPRINFIIGPNGSGKSAILAATILGFGSRSSHTNRGSGLSSFIKTGQSRAKITIKLCNYIDDETKSEGYRPDMYGKTIIIERVIYATNVSNYKIRDQNGKVISEKKEEVDNITKHFDILVDNPVCVLTQEISKNFLNSKNPKDKFKFFTKATQLEDVKRDYETALSHKDNSVRVLEDKCSTIKMYQVTLKNYDKKVKVIKMLQTSVEKMKTLAQESFWAICYSNKRDLDKEQAIFNALEAKYEQANKNCEESAQKMAHLQSKKDELIQDVDNLTSRVEAFKLELDAAAAESENAERALASKQREINRLTTEIRRNKQNIRTVKTRIEGIELQNRERENIDFEAEIEQIRAQIETVEEEQNALKEKIAKLQAEREELSKKRSHYAEDERRAVARFNSANSEIERLNRSQKNRYERYKPNTSRVITEIEAAVQARHFKRRPFGPIGEYIQLQDPSAAFAAETLLNKNTLCAFIVDNFDDSKILKKIFLQCYGPNAYSHPDIIVRKYAPLHDVQHYQAQSEFPNFLQLFNIKEPEVANCLIDHFSIEKMLYIPNFRQAQRLLINPDTAPRNCIKAFTEQGDTMMPATDRNDYKCYPNKNPSKTPTYLIRDFTQAIAEYKNTAAFQKQASTAARQEIIAADQQLGVITREIGQTDASFREIRMKLIEMKKKRDDLMEKAQIQPVEVVALKEDVERFTLELEQFEIEEKKCMEERNQLKEVYTQKTNVKNEKETQYNEMVHSRVPTNAKIENLDHQLIQLNKQIERINALKEEVLSKKRESEEVIQQKLEQYNISREAALKSTNGEVIETERTLSDVKAEIERFKEIIAENEEMANPEKQREVVAEYKNLMAVVKRLAGEFQIMNNYIELLKETMKKRKAAYHHMRYYMTRVINFFFSHVLKQKEFSGSITPYFYDMVGEDGKQKKAQTLEVVIYPRNKEQFVGENGSSQATEAASSIYSTTKSLSGGERSYSTVAFIIALWQICPSPFRLLDEVDVFMDMVTRKISIDTLIWFATERSSKQFIFLSPLHMQKLDNPECVTINFMPEPERD